METVCLLVLINPVTHNNIDVYVDSVGKNAKKIEEYILNQIQDDQAYDQMSLKEYIDPFTGEPVGGSSR